ncbi:hypothetical protein ACFPM0_35515 [Pseudonocardia sulfidoxydans]
MNHARATDLGRPLGCRRRTFVAIGQPPVGHVEITVAPKTLRMVD